MNERTQVRLEDCEAGKSYWLTLRWNDEGTWRDPMYSGRILSYDALTVEVEIDVAGLSARESATSREKHPRAHLIVEELPEGFGA